MTKLLKLFLAISILVFVFSCGKDDDPVAKGDGLEGTWATTAMTADVSTTALGSTSTVKVTGSNFDYDLTFTEDAFTTEGSYTATNEISAGGVNQSQSVDIANINGAGTYSADGNVITIESGSFFSFESAGLPGAGDSDNQMANYEINGDVMTMTQNQTIDDDSNGITTSTTIRGTYTFERK